MSYNGKNYAEQGGDKWVIGGTLEIKEGATVTGLPEGEAYSLPVASASALGGVKRRQKAPGILYPSRWIARATCMSPLIPLFPPFPRAAKSGLIVWQQRWRPLVTGFLNGPAHQVEGRRAL